MGLRGSVICFLFFIAALSVSAQSKQQNSHLQYLKFDTGDCDDTCRAFSFEITTTASIILDLRAGFPAKGKFTRYMRENEWSELTAELDNMNTVKLEAEYIPEPDSASEASTVILPVKIYEYKYKKKKQHTEYSGPVPKPMQRMEHLIYRIVKSPGWLEVKEEE